MYRWDKIRIGCFLLCVVFFLTSSGSVDVGRAEGNLIFVSNEGTGTSCTQAAPCDRIQGLSNAVSGDTIYFKWGAYTDTLSDPFLTITKAVTLIGSWDGAATGDVVTDLDYYTTIIDGGNARGLFVVYDSSGDLITISGFRFQEGSVTQIENLRLEGGAIYVANGKVDIVNNEFLNNFAESYGGAISIQSEFDVRIIGNYFDGNDVEFGGGSIYVTSPNSDNNATLIEDNIFTGGYAEYGSSITNWNAAMTINRNKFIDTLNISAVHLSSIKAISTVSNNFFIRPAQNAIDSTDTPENGIPHQIINNTIVDANYGILAYSGSPVNIVNNIITGCSISIHSFGGPLTGSNNLFFDNISDPNPLTNPILESDPDFEDPANDDFHISDDSPAKNAGITVPLTDDFDGESRPSGGGYDIGADEVESGMEIYIPILLK